MIDRKKKHVLYATRHARLFTIVATLVFVSACSGAPGASNSASSLGSSQPTSYVGGNGLPSEIHVVIEDGVAKSLLVGPADVPPPPGFVTRPLALGIVQYPDGSTQITDARGRFDPSESAYGIANAAELENNPDAAPIVLIADPADAVPPIVAELDAAKRATSPSTSGTVLPQNAYVHLLDADAGVLGSIAVHPRTQNAIDGTSLALEATAHDTDGHVTSFGATPVTWTVSAGSIHPFPGTAWAIYTAPTIGSGLASITASASSTASAAPLTSGATIAYVDRSSLATVDGTLANAGIPVARGTMAFYQRSGLPTRFRPFLWFASVRDGRFHANLPPHTHVVPLARDSGRSTFGLVTAASGLPDFLSPSLTDRATTPAFSLPLAAPAFVDTAQVTPPPIAASIHDAWYATRLPFQGHIFDADSGLQPILAKPGAIPSGIVSAGPFRFWHYTWTGSPLALVLVSADRNGAPGRESAIVTPTTTPDTFAFARYDAPISLSLAEPLVAAQTGTLLRAGGTWTQTVTAHAFNATVTESHYAGSHQNVAAPLYTETLGYARDALGGIAITRDTLSDAAGRRLWTLDATRTGYVAANAGTTTPVYGFDASLVRYYRSHAGETAKHFALVGTANGDGSGHVASRNVDSSVTTSYDLAPSASLLARATNGTVVDANIALPIATFTITKNYVVEAVVGADPAAGVPGTPIAFPL